MNDLKLDTSGLEELKFSAGDVIMREGERSDCVLILKSGAVSIRAVDREICKINEPHSIFGEISALLDTEHSATVTAVEDSVFWTVPNFAKDLEANADRARYVAIVLAKRLVHMNFNFLEIRAELEELKASAVDGGRKGKLGGIIAKLDEFWGSSIF